MTDGPGDRRVVLRGLTVGRANRLSIVELREALAEADCRGARTHLQSGNAVVEAPAATTTGEAATRIATTVAALAELVRTTDDLTENGAAGDVSRLR